jgi:hypothetical protein
MSNPVRALAPRRLARGPQRLVLLVSSATAAARLSVTQVLIRRRSSGRGGEHKRRRVLGRRREAAHEVRQMTAGEPDQAAPVLPAELPPDWQAAAVFPPIPEIRPDPPAWPLPPDRRLVLLAPALRRVYRRGRQALSRVRKKPTDERWHELAGRSKDLWRLSELLQPATPKRMKKVSKQAHRLSNLLGENHDLVRLEQRLPEGPLSERDLKLLKRLIARRRRELQDEARPLAQRLYRQKPGKFARRLGLS